MKRILAALALACVSFGASAQTYPSPRLKTFQVDDLPIFASCNGPLRGNGPSASTCAKIVAGDLASGVAVANLGFTPLRPSSNLSDLTSISTARTNLGLGALATASTVTDALVSNSAAIKASKCAYLSPATGAVTRDCNTKLAEVLVATDFGADATAATDSCTAITNAIATLPAGLSGFGGTLYFPKGVYITSCWPTMADKAISIVGAGSGQTQIVFTASSAGNAGLRFTYNTPVATLVPQVRDIGLITSVNQTTGNACISITRPSIALIVPNPGPFIQDVYCGGTGTTYWADGITCAYCTFLSIQKTQIIGAGVTGATVGTNMARGIFLDNTIDANIYDTHVYYANKGVSIANDAEGLKLDISSFVMVDWGVYTENSWIGPSLVVSNTHFNVTTGGIHVTGGSTGQTSQSQVHDNLIYRIIAATENPWVGIECLNGVGYGCNDHSFNNNNIMAFKGAGPTGVANCFRLGSSTARVSISGNTCRDADYFIDMGSGVSAGVSISNNHGIGTANTAWQQNQNINARWSNNEPALFGTSDIVAITQGLNNTAWNLSGSPITSYLTNSSVATTVTDGNGGFPGLIVSVRCADTNTKIANASGPTKFALASAADFTCPRVGATISFQYSDQWREIGRVP